MNFFRKDIPKDLLKFFVPAGTDEIGREKTPQEFVDKMVAVFRAVRRVLRDDGTLWLNLGDSYNRYPGNGLTSSPYAGDRSVREQKFETGYGRAVVALPSGNLVGVPWRVALALQADGWVLRQDVIWAKPSPMPESVRNRCTKAHEYVFLLTKSMRYYSDMEAIKERNKEDERHQSENRRLQRMTRGVASVEGRGQSSKAIDSGEVNPDRVMVTGAMSNKRSVWTITSQGYPGAHFATFPPELPRLCIKAGTSEHGACAGCGAPYKRVVEEKKLRRERPNDYVKRTGEYGTGNSCANSVAGVETVTVGWERSCKCDSGGIAPCLVLDPFVGSGTTCEVALELGRSSIGIDLSEEYLRNNAIPRIEGAMASRPELAALTGRETKRVSPGRKMTPGVGGKK